MRHFDKGDPGLLHDELAMIDDVLRGRKEVYFKGANGKLLPTRKDQPPRDPRYFKQT
jgi:hypothetical protein